MVLTQAQKKDSQCESTAGLSMEVLAEAFYQIYTVMASYRRFLFQYRTPNKVKIHRLIGEQCGRLEHRILKGRHHGRITFSLRNRAQEMIVHVIATTNAVRDVRARFAPQNAIPSEVGPQSTTIPRINTGNVCKVGFLFGSYCGVIIITKV